MARAPNPVKVAKEQASLDVSLQGAAAFGTPASLRAWDSTPGYLRHQNAIQADDPIYQGHEVDLYNGPRGFWASTKAGFDEGYTKYGGWLDIQKAKWFGDDQAATSDDIERLIKAQNLEGHFAQFVRDKTTNSQSLDIAAGVARRWQDDDAVFQHSSTAASIAGSLLGGLLTPEGVAIIAAGAASGGASLAAKSTSLAGRIGAGMLQGAAENSILVGATSDMTPYDNLHETLFAGLLGAAFGGFGAAIGHVIKIRRDGSTVTPYDQPRVDTVNGQPPKAPVDGSGSDIVHVGPAGDARAAAARGPAVADWFNRQPNGSTLTIQAARDMLDGMTERDLRTLGINRDMHVDMATRSAGSDEAAVFVNRLIDEGVDPSTARINAKLNGHDVAADAGAFARTGKDFVTPLSDGFGVSFRTTLRRAGVDAIDNSDAHLDSQFAANARSKLEDMLMGMQNAGSKDRPKLTFEHEAEPHQPMAETEGVHPVDLDETAYGKLEAAQESGKTDAELLSERDLDGNPIYHEDVPADRYPGPAASIQDFLGRPARLGTVDDVSPAMQIAEMERQHRAIAGSEAPEALKLKPSEAATDIGTMNKRTAELMDEQNGEYVPVARNFGGSSKLSVGQALAGSENGLVRKVFSKFASPVLGYADNSTVKSARALDRVRAERMKLHAWDNEVIGAGFDSWSREKGLFGASFSITRAKQYSQELMDTYKGRVPRGQSPALDAATDGIAERMRGYLSAFAEHGEEWAVRELKRFETNPEARYMPRQWALGMLEGVKDMHGEEGLARNIGAAIRSGYEQSGRLDHGIDDAMLVPIGKGFVDNVMATAERDRLIRAGIDPDAKLRADLEAQGIKNQDLINDIVGEAGSTPRTAGTPGFMKSRTPLDENFVTDLKDAQGNAFTISDLLNNDATNLVRGYMSRAEGELALRSVGFKNGLASAMEDVEAATKGAVGHIAGYAEKAAERDRTRLEYVVRHIAGIPRVENPSSVPWMLSRIIRNLNFAQYMGGLGIAQLGETSMILSHSGASAAFKQIPALGELFRWTRNLTGKEADAFTKEIQVMGLGVQRDGHRMVQLYQDVDGLIDTGRLHPATDAERLAGYVKDDWRNKRDRLLQSAEHKSAILSNTAATLSGGNAMTDTLRTWGARSSIQNLVDWVHAGRIDPLKADFEKMIGMDDARLARLMPVLKKHPELSKHGGVQKLNMDAIRAEDPEAAMMIRDYVLRRTNRTILDPDPTTLPMIFGKSPIAAVAAHLKTFAIAGQTAHLYSGLATGNNALGILAPAAVYGAALSALQVMSRIWFQTLGMDENERKQVWQQRFGTPETRAVTVGNSMSTVGLLPQALATAAQVAGVDDEAFAFSRQSGLSGSFLGGIPAVGMEENARKGLTSALSRDGGPTLTHHEQKQLRTLIPLQNTPVIQQALNWMMSKQDERDEDDAHQAKYDLEYGHGVFNDLFGGKKVPDSDTDD